MSDQQTKVVFIGGEPYTVPADATIEQIQEALAGTDTRAKSAQQTQPATSGFMGAAREIVQRMIDAGEEKTVRTVNPRTGQTQWITPQEFSGRTTGLEYLENLAMSPIEGAKKLWHGAQALWTGEHPGETPTGYPRYRAINEMVGGVGTALTPAMYEFGGGAVAPAVTKTLGLGGSFSPIAQATKIVAPALAAQKTTETVAQAAGVPSDVAEFAGNVAGGVAGYATPKGIGAFQEWRKGPVSTQFARQVDDITRALPSSAHAMMADTPTAAAQTTEAALPDVIAQINADPELSAQWGAWKPGAFRNQPIEILRAATNKAIKAIEEIGRAHV